MMIVMVDAINRQYFGGKQVVTCYSCHRFGKVPKVIPELVMQYSDLTVSTGAHPSRRCHRENGVAPVL
jgi:hypothetical protein